MKEKIEEFLKSDKIELKLDYIVPNDLIKIITALGYICYDRNTNGWQHDFWFYYNKGDEKLCFGGSWYYGSYYLSKEVDDEDDDQ